jgi:hypothetical protein
MEKHFDERLDCRMSVLMVGLVVMRDQKQRYMVYLSSLSKGSLGTTAAENGD